MLVGVVFGVVEAVAEELEVEPVAVKDPGGGLADALDERLAGGGGGQPEGAAVGVPAALEHVAVEVAEALDEGLERLLRGLLRHLVGLLLGEGRAGRRLEGGLAVDEAGAEADDVADHVEGDVDLEPQLARGLRELHAVALFQRGLAPVEVEGGAGLGDDVAEALAGLGQLVQVGLRRATGGGDAQVLGDLEREAGAHAADEAVDGLIVLVGLPGVGLDEVVEVPLRAVHHGVAQGVLDDLAHRARVVERHAGPHDAVADLAGEAGLALLDDVDAADKELVGAEVDLVEVRNAKVLLLAGEDDGVEHLLVGHLQVGGAVVGAQVVVDLVADLVEGPHRDAHHRRHPLLAADAAGGVVGVAVLEAPVGRDEVETVRVMDNQVAGPDVEVVALGLEVVDVAGRGLKRAQLLDGGEGALARLHAGEAQPKDVRLIRAVVEADLPAQAAPEQPEAGAHFFPLLVDPPRRLALLLGPVTVAGVEALPEGAGGGELAAEHARRDPLLAVGVVEQRAVSQGWPLYVADGDQLVDARRPDGVEDFRREREAAGRAREEGGVEVVDRPGVLHRAPGGVLVHAAGAVGGKQAHGESLVGADEALGAAVVEAPFNSRTVGGEVERADQFVVGRVEELVPDPDIGGAHLLAGGPQEAVVGGAVDDACMGQDPGDGPRVRVADHPADGREPAVLPHLEPRDSGGLLAAVVGPPRGVRHELVDAGRLDDPAVADNEGGVAGDAVAVLDAEALAADEVGDELDVVLARRGYPAGELEQEERREAVAGLAVEGVHVDLQRRLLRVGAGPVEAGEVVLGLDGGLDRGSAQSLVVGGGPGERQHPLGAGDLLAGVAVEAPQVGHLLGEGAAGRDAGRRRPRREGGRGAVALGEGLLAHEAEGGGDLDAVAPGAAVDELKELLDGAVGGEDPLHLGALGEEVDQHGRVEADLLGPPLVEDRPAAHRAAVEGELDRVEPAALRLPVGRLLGREQDLLGREVVGHDERRVQRGEVEAGDGPVGGEGLDGGAHRVHIVRAVGGRGRSRVERGEPPGVGHDPLLGREDVGAGVLAALLALERDHAEEHVAPRGVGAQQVADLHAAGVVVAVEERHEGERAHLAVVVQDVAAHEQLLAAHRVDDAVVADLAHVLGAALVGLALGLEGGLVVAPHPLDGHVGLAGEAADLEVELERAGLRRLALGEELLVADPHVDRDAAGHLEVAAVEDLLGGDLDLLVAAVVPAQDRLVGRPAARRGRHLAEHPAQDAQLARLLDDEGPVVVAVVEAHQEVGRQGAPAEGEGLQDVGGRPADDRRPGGVGRRRDVDDADLLQRRGVVLPVGRHADHEAVVVVVLGVGDVARAPAAVGLDVPGDDEGAVLGEEGRLRLRARGRLALLLGRQRVDERPEARDGDAEEVGAERRRVGGARCVLVVAEHRPVAQREAVLAGGLAVVAGPVVGGRRHAGAADRGDGLLPLLERRRVDAPVGVRRHAVAADRVGLDRLD